MVLFANESREIQKSVDKTMMFLENVY